MTFGAVSERFQWVLASLYSSPYKESLLRPLSACLQNRCIFLRMQADRGKSEAIAKERARNKKRLYAYHCSSCSAPRHTPHDQLITALKKAVAIIARCVPNVQISKVDLVFKRFLFSNGEITSVGLKMERKNTNKYLGGLRMEYSGVQSPQTEYK